MKTKTDSVKTPRR